ncbi:GMC family oxidoreductase [Aspergillus stella-maris]|uniref:GMC family oxidoreductase n=1 Tax=Aspergillus stella-maris TaxID=1810926 RepID=UPI003CCDE8E5
MGRAFLLALASFVAPSLAVIQGQLGTDATYDYVVVGGGTSGLAIAARLAEDPSLSVAVIEAGGYYEQEGGPPNVIPGFAGAANTGTDPTDLSTVDWNFNTLPLEEGDNRALRYARGRTLGGSSARHYMVYQRGTKGVYNEWADITGDDSWTWDSVLPYFKKSVTLTPANATSRFPNASVSYNPGAFENSGGPLHVTWPNYGSSFSTWLDRGLEALGIMPDTDFNSGSLNGSSWAPVTINPRNQTRDSSETSFLRHARDLTIYPHTLAMKIDFDGTTATGVRVKSSGRRYTLSARQEVILSAGAFQSPQMLMISGIGPRETLDSLDIPVIKDAPGVGQNMWDHPMFGVVHEVNVETTSLLLQNPQAAAQAVEQYKVKQGPLTSPGFGVLGWERIPENLLSNEAKQALSAFPSDWPTLEYLSVDGILDGWHSAADQLVGDHQQWASIGVALVSPLSRGNITILSDDAQDPPVIQLGYLTHPVDREIAVTAVRRLRQAWAATNITIGAEYLPGSDVQTDEEILDFIRSVMSPVFHPAGTCAMGQEGDPRAVVDSQARVIGVNKLRVVDASIFPTLPPGHPQSSCYMVAEKIADDIKNGN